MPATMPRLSGGIRESKPGRRRESRYATTQEAALRTSKGDSAMVTLSDVSLQGCAIECSEAWLRVGSFVTVAVNGGEPLTAIVRWIRDGHAGMEFMAPIPPERTEWLDIAEVAY